MRTRNVTTRLLELKAATRAIGETVADRLAWVVRFISEDPAAWHPAVRAAHGDCLLALGRHGIPGNVAIDDPPQSLDPGDVETLHAEIRTMLRDLLGKHPTRPAMVALPSDGIEAALVRLTRAGRKPAMFAISYGHQHPRTAICHTIASLIVQAGAQLIACPGPGCGTPFIAIRKQEYCTPRCAQRARNEKKGDTRPRKTARRKGVRP